MGQSESINPQGSRSRSQLNHHDEKSCQDWALLHPTLEGHSSSWHKWWNAGGSAASPAGSLQQPGGLSRKVTILPWHGRSSEAPDSNCVFRRVKTEHKLLCPVLSSRFDYEVSHSPGWHIHILFIWLELEFMQECSSSVCGFYFSSRFLTVKNKLLPHSFEWPGLFWIKTLVGLKFWHEILIVSHWLKGFLFIPPRTRS